MASNSSGLVTPSRVLTEMGPSACEKTSSRKASSFERSQHSGTLAFGGDSAGRAAEVEVDFSVAHLPQFADHPGGQSAVFGQQLGDDRRTGVRRRVQLRHLLFDKHPVLGRGDEGGIIAGRRAGRPEPALVRLTPDSVSEALHGGGVVVHVSSPLSV